MEQLKHILFIDIETVPCVPEFNILNLPQVTLPSPTSFFSTGPVYSQSFQRWFVYASACWCQMAMAGSYG